MTFTIPAFSWWYLGIFCGVYGLFTHLVSLPGIERYNKKHGIYTLNTGDLIGLMFFRIFLSLPVRLVFFVVGILRFSCIPIELLATRKLNFENMFLKDSLKWYGDPEDIGHVFQSMSSM